MHPRTRNCFSGGDRRRKPGGNASPISQKDACQAVYFKARMACIRVMSKEDVILHLESASTLGRAWLDVIPTRPGLILSDKEISSALALRACHSVSNDWTCHICGKPYKLLHNDHCELLKGPRVTRHNAVMHALASALRTIRGIQIEIEPPIEGSPSLRNDIRVIALQSSAIQDLDIDITVGSLTSARGCSFQCAFPIKSLEAAHLALDKIVAQQRQIKLDKVAAIQAYTRRNYFHIFPISPGGYCDTEATRFFSILKKALSPSSFSHLKQQIAIILVRARANGARIN